VVSGYSIHHQPDERKREIYAEIYDLLRPGGLFINVEHVASIDPWVEGVFQDLFVDRLYAFQQANGSTMSREEVDRTFYSRPDKVANILAPVEDQCRWLRAIGYKHVDCYLKIFELAVFGGVKMTD
nr:class I SAM-dependent methyltransferase [Chloroflexota bacterium]